MLREKVEITRISSRGQVVIPYNLREKLKLGVGTLLAIDVTNKGLIVMKPIRSPIQEADLKEIEKAWKEIEKGKYKEATAAEFLRELRRW